MDSFELAHCGNSLSIYNVKYSPADARSGNPYNTSFNIKVISGLFSGVGDCEYDMKELIVFATQINELYQFQRSNVKLHDICYGSWVDFEMDKLGHLTINGEIYGSAMVHSLKFEFTADQTSLKNFALSLQSLTNI